MAVTTIDPNNKLIKFTQEINREYVRENLFSPYMGDAINSIIRRRYEMKAGGEQMNIPMVTRLSGTAIGAGTLVGNEERIDNYGMRLWLDWARKAVVTNKAQSQKDSADIFGEAKPLLTDWGNELQRDEIISALMALPSESQPALLGVDPGGRVNGILFESSTVAQRNTWLTDNTDRVIFGALVSNHSSGVFATAATNVDTTADKFTAANLSLAKRVAKTANPKIRPYKLGDGREYFVAFAGTNSFRDLKLDLATTNKDARPRESGIINGAPNNPLFQDGDQIYDGVIVREVPEISAFVDTVWTLLKTAGATSGRIEPVFLCGQAAATIGWGQMAKPTFRKEDDYGFVTGTGIEMAYGVGKMFKKHPNTGTKLVQWGIVTGFYASLADS
jgi:Protein of unknown function (DUF4043)